MTFEEMFGPAKWMSPDEENFTPCYRRVFTVPAVKKASLTICGLGFFEAWLNGTRIGDDLFVPLDTNYFPRTMEVNGRPFQEKMESRILCPQYDVTPLLREGKNVLCVQVGPGYYHYDHTPSYGPSRLAFCLALEGAAGEKSTVCSDEALRWQPSEVKVSEFTRGEEHDYRLLPKGWLALDYDDSGWRAVREAPAPETVYERMDSPADRVFDVLTPKLLLQKDGKKVYDLGENISCRPLVFSEAPAGTRLTLRFSEERTSEGGLDEKSVTDLYTQHLVLVTDGTPRTMTSRFTWFAARYVELSGPAELTGFENIHADVAFTARFSCSDPVLNWTNDAFRRTQLANMHGGIPSDCPHIERRGYTGDGELVGETAMLLFDAEKFYRKWIRDISDCQDRVSGHVQYTAPFVPSGGGPGGWGSAIVEVPYTFYRVYGDDTFLKSLYPQMLHYFDYLETHSRDGLVVSDEPDCWCLGDWCTPEPVCLPEPYVNTYFYIKSLRRVLTFCPKTDRARLARRAEELAAAMKKAYWDEATGSFCGGVQGADAFAVDLGFGDGRTFENLVQKYTRLGMYDTGIFGTDILTRVLFERGQGELAYSLLGSTGPWSYDHWRRQGATTLWEYWTGKRSHSHPMFGAAVRYFYQYLLGIRQPDDSAGFAKVLVAPSPVAALASAEGSLLTKRGRVTVRRRRENGELKLTVTLEKPMEAVLRWDGHDYPLSQGENDFSFAD